MKKGFEDTQRLAQSVVRQKNGGASRKTSRVVFWGRKVFVATVLLILPAAIVVRAGYMQWQTRAFLQAEGDARVTRLSRLDAWRGTIVDRNGEELAISVPSQSVWMDTKEFEAHIQEDFWRSEKAKRLAKLLGMERKALRSLVEARKGRRFDYLARDMRPKQAEHIRALKIPGIHLLEEQRRFYPTGEVAAHVVGFTDIDGHGLEGAEKAYDQWLKGEPGEQLIKRDLLGNVFELGNVIRPPKDGKNLVLSIDSRIQTLAYIELKKEVVRTRAAGGSAIVLDATTGEVLAMVNQPSYNPNNRANLKLEALRNRALTDVFEPGSTFKPFTALAAVESGRFTPHTLVDTSPGAMKVNGYWVRDDHNLGRLSLTGIIQKSSNIGVSKVAMALPTDVFVNNFYRLGFGVDTGTGFPGESAGLFQERTRWSDIEKATLAYGYGIGVTAAQLARAYAALANGGWLLPLGLVHREHPAVGERIARRKAVTEVVAMMEQVVRDGGTGTRARVKGYRVAGKTGTARKAVHGAYGDDYLSVFAGLAPISNPRLVVVVVVDSPRGEHYYGGEVAAPVFSAIMERSLRWLDIPPDAIELEPNVAWQAAAGAASGGAP